MKTLYHGTASPYLSAIFRSGLRPMPSNRWKVSLDSPYTSLGMAPIGANGRWNQNDDAIGIYLAEKRDARAFAIMRAEYLSARPGQHIKPVGVMVGMVKDEDAPVIRNASPALIAVSLPDSWPLAVDTHLGQGDGSGRISPRTIPPQYLKVVPL